MEYHERLLNILLTPDVRPNEKQGIKDRFYHECLLLSKLDHPNVVEFIGVQLQPDPLLIMESLHIDLDRFLNVQHEIQIMNIHNWSLNPLHMHMG